MKAAIYCRLSEEDRNKQYETDDSNSIQNQKMMLLQYAMAQGWEVYNIYSDDDYTGADRKRPEFNRLLKDAEAKKFDIILCKTQSRFTRELELVEKYIHGLFPVWGIRFISIVDNADTANKGNKKSRQINGLVNEWYLEDMSENIKSVLTNRRRNGLHIGAFAPYGYKKDPDRKGHLIIDEEAAAVVREVFTLYAQGHGMVSIARMLNDRGIPNPLEYKFLHGEQWRRQAMKSGKLWKYSTISSMLNNEVYIGNMVQGRFGSVSYKTQQVKPKPKSEWIRVDGTHEPVINQELWERVQTMKAGKVKPNTTGEVGPFAGKARCLYCGYVMLTNKTKGIRYLHCPNHFVSREACPGSYIAEAKLEQTVLSQLKRLTSDYLDMDEVERKAVFHNTLQQDRERLEKDLGTFRTKRDEYVRGLKELYLDKVRGIITEKDYLELSQEFVEGRNRMEEQMQDAEVRLKEIAKQIAQGETRRQMAEKYTDAKALTREMTGELIDYVLVGKRIPGTRNVPVEIHWAF